jgi:hypothetical protein
MADNVPALAFTLNVPGMSLAVSVGAVALPLALVRIGIGGVVANVPLAPPALGVTVNVTATPEMGRPIASVTRTCSAEHQGKHICFRSNRRLRPH